jgi:hypothetical protein
MSIRAGTGIVSAGLAPRTYARFTARFCSPNPSIHQSAWKGFSPKLMAVGLRACYYA